jgi:hypothetical protein
MGGTRSVLRAVLTPSCGVRVPAVTLSISLSLHDLSFHGWSGGLLVLLQIACQCDA